MNKSNLLSVIFFFTILFNVNATDYKIEATKNSNYNTIEKVRLKFTSPNGFARDLLLGFLSDNGATDGVDYGYDAAVDNNFSNDMNWMIEGDRFVIQAVGAFNETKKYPLGLFLDTGGLIKVELTELVDFAVTPNVYIHDAVLNTYTQINTSSFTTTVDVGNYTNRFYIAFNEPTNNNNEDEDEDEDNDDEDNDDEDNDDEDNDDDDDEDNDDEDNDDEDNDDEDNDDEDNDDEDNGSKMVVNYLQSVNKLAIKTKKKNIIYSIALYDFSGEMIKMKYNNKKDNRMRMNLNNVEGNTFILIANTKKGTLTKKIAINK